MESSERERERAPFGRIAIFIFICNNSKMSPKLSPDPLFIEAIITRLYSPSSIQLESSELILCFIAVIRFETKERVAKARGGWGGGGWQRLGEIAVFAIVCIRRTILARERAEWNRIIA